MATEPHLSHGLSCCNMFVPVSPSMCQGPFDLSLVGGGDPPPPQLLRESASAVFWGGGGPPP